MSDTKKCSSCSQSASGYFITCAECHALEAELIENINKKNTLLLEGLMEIINYEHTDHLDVIGVELKEIAQECINKIDAR